MTMHRRINHAEIDAGDVIEFSCHGRNKLFLILAKRGHWFEMLDLNNSTRRAIDFVFLSSTHWEGRFICKQQLY